MKNNSEVPKLARHANEKLNGFYADHFGKSHTIHFAAALRQYSDMIDARMISSKGEENEVAAMVHLYNSTDNKIIKAWFLAAVWEMVKDKKIIDK